MFRPGETVLVHVSGGPDSVCLLESLLRLRRLFRITLEVFHFDHALREDSARDAAYVRRLAERHRVPFHLRVAQRGPDLGMSVEAWATLERGRGGEDVRREIGAAVVAEGHTLDDQAETVLLNIIRGTGLDGVAGIVPAGRSASPGGRGSVLLVQPMIEVERAEAEAFCRALHLRPRRDPMNDDARFLRAAIRHRFLPEIERAVGRDVRHPIARTAANVRTDRDELDRQAAAALPEVVEHDGVREIRFDVEALRALGPALAGRAIRLGVGNVPSSDATAPWSKDAIDAILDLSNGRPGRRRDLPFGSTAVRDRRYVRVSFASPASGPSPEG